MWWYSEPFTFCNSMTAPGIFCIRSSSKVNTVRGLLTNNFVFPLTQSSIKLQSFKIKFVLSLEQPVRGFGQVAFERILYLQLNSILQEFVKLSDSWQKNFLSITPPPPPKVNVNSDLGWLNFLLTTVRCFRNGWSKFVTQLTIWNLYN